jgi:phage recombination protein Bet
MKKEESLEEISVIKDLIAKGLTDVEFQYFLARAKRAGLDPISGQISAIKYGNNVTIITTIDGLRLIAERSNKYAGQRAPVWCGKDGVWREVWLEKEPPSAAKVGILRHDFIEPLFAIACWDSYKREYNGKLSNMWNKMPDLMLAKVAEALALRKAFPNDLSGLYTKEEMMQADHEPIPESKKAEISAMADLVKQSMEASKTNGKALQLPVVSEQLTVESQEQKEVPPPPTTTQNPPPKSNGKRKEFTDVNELKKAMQTKINNFKKEFNDDKICSDSMAVLHAGFSSLCIGKIVGKRKPIIKFFTGKESSRYLLEAEAQALIKWMDIKYIPEEEIWVPNMAAVHEGEMICKFLIDSNQTAPVENLSEFEKALGITEEKGDAYEPEKAAEATNDTQFADDIYGKTLFNK